MKPFYKVVLLIPVGPACTFSFIKDTIESFIYYCSSSHRIIIADDSGTGMGLRLATIFPQIDVVKSKSYHGKLCKLYINISNALALAIEKYKFGVLMKLDTDAMVIGSLPELDAIDYFEKNPSVGIAGQYPFDYAGNPWNYRWPRKRIINNVTTWKFFSRPAANWHLRKWYLKALKVGYTAGENVFGGAYFMSTLCVEKLFNAGLLPDYRLAKVHLEEDHLFSLLVQGVGMKLGNLSSGDGPFACAWRGLPDDPNTLAGKGKKIIHSTRFWKGQKEDEIRAVFRSLRVDAETLADTGTIKYSIHE